jgi:hypothetical protein
VFAFDFAPPCSGGVDFNKKPAIDWRSRVFGNLCLVWLEVPSHDASAAVPHGRLSSDSLSLTNDKRGRHLLTA